MITTIQIEFRVRALGTPKPSIQWYKDDLEIFSCDRIEMREEEDGGAVVLKGARYMRRNTWSKELFVGCVIQHPGFLCSKSEFTQPLVHLFDNT